MVRFDPFREIEELQERLSRAFGGQASDNRTWAPPVDVVETEQGLQFAVYLPGVDPEKVEVSSDQSTLTVKAEREAEKPEGASYHRMEGLYGTFVRSFTVPQSFELAKVQARFKNGVLYLEVPKAESAQPRRIQVHIG